MTVKVGQLGADNDPREIKRGTRQHLRVVGIDRFAADRDDHRAHLNNEDTGIDTWVLIRRMKPNARGYRLVEDVAE